MDRRRRRTSRSGQNDKMGVTPPWGPSLSLFTGVAWDVTLQKLLFPSRSQSIKTPPLTSILLHGNLMYFYWHRSWHSSLQRPNALALMAFSWAHAPRHTDTAPPGHSWVALLMLLVRLVGGLLALRGLCCCFLLWPPLEFLLLLLPLRDEEARRPCCCCPLFL